MNPGSIQKEPIPAARLCESRRAADFFIHSSLLCLFIQTSPPRSLRPSAPSVFPNRGADFNSKVPRSAVCQGRWFRLTPEVKRRMRLCGRTSWRVVTPSRSTRAVEESPAVRLFRTSPGRFVRKPRIAACRQRRAPPSGRA